MKYFCCIVCEDHFIMDEDYVDTPDPQDSSKTIRHGADYRGNDCICPVCGCPAGELVDQKRKEF